MGNKDYIIRNKHYIHAKQTYWCVFIISIILAVCSVYKFINDADNLFYIISSIQVNALRATLLR